MGNYLLPQGHTELVAELSPYKTLVAMVIKTIPDDFSYTPPPHPSSLLWGMSNQGHVCLPRMKSCPSYAGTMPLW